MKSIICVYIMLGYFYELVDVDFQNFCSDVG